jgi:hypothetical protein
VRAHNQRSESEFVRCADLRRVDHQVEMNAATVARHASEPQRSRDQLARRPCGTAHSAPHGKQADPLRPGGVRWETRAPRVRPKASPRKPGQLVEQLRGADLANAVSARAEALSGFGALDGWEGRGSDRVRKDHEVQQAPDRWSSPEGRPCTERWRGERLGRPTSRPTLRRAFAAGQWWPGVSRQAFPEALTLLAMA